MSRRYLTTREATFAINRNKDIEIFIGGFIFENKKCIRWASFSLEKNYIVGKIWESFDEGSENFLDIYCFSPVLEEYDKPVETVRGTTLTEVVKEMKLTEDKFVNSGVVQDEYADYLRTST